MAIKDSVLNFVIKAKNLAGDVLSKFGKDVAQVDNTSEAAAKSVDALGKAADELGKEAGTASAKTKSLEGALSGIDAKANSAADGMDETAKKAADAAKKIFDSGVAADKAAASVGKMGQRFDAAGKPIGTARQEIKNTNNELEKVDGTSAKAGSSIGSFTKRLLALATAAVGVNTLKNAIGDMLNTGDNFERLGLQMQQVMGSIQGGKQATEWVKEFAQNTPLQLSQVTDTFVQLKNFGLDPQAGAMQAIVDQAAKLGKGYEAVEGISLALGQAWTKQKLQGDDILQLINRGVPVWELLAKVTGKNTAELQKMSEAGLIGRDTIKALIDEMGKQSTGAAAQNMSLLSGYISNLKDEWALFQNEIAQAGALDYAKAQLRDLIQYIQELKKNGQLQAFAKQISDSFISIVESGKTLALAIGNNIGAIKDLTVAWLAFKAVSAASSITDLAKAFKTDLGGAITAVEVKMTNLGTLLRGAAWLAVAGEIWTTAKAFIGLSEAIDRQNAAQQNVAKVQEDAAAQIAKFNEQTGLAVKSLDEIIAAQDAGSAAIDEYTGKWRLATDQLTAAEKAERANAEAMKAAQKERETYLSQVDALLAKFNQVKSTSADVSKAIADMGAEALKSGEGGIQALATAIQNLEVYGDATKEQLQTGLAKFLAGLSDEQYSQFGENVKAALEKISKGSGAASASLGALSALLDGDLRAAAERVGIDLGEVLTGIDQESKTAIASFTVLAEKLHETATAGDDSDKILKAGLLATLKSLDSTKEIDATRKALQQLATDGVITNEALAALNAQLDQQAKSIQSGVASQQAATQANKEAADSWGLIAVEANNATHEMSAAGGIAKWVQDQYKALRDEVVALGPAAAAAFDKLQNVNPNTEFLRDEFGDLKQAIADSTNEIERLQQVSTVADFTGINRFLKEAAINAELVKKEYAEQKLALERLQKAYADGAISAQQFINSARGASSSTSLLNDADLSALRSQIKAAQEQMESLRDSTLGTLNSLQSELADLQGNAERVAQLAYESRMADLNAKLDEAKKSGDKEAIANAQEALRIAKEIYDVKKRQLADDKKAAEEAKAADAAAKAEAAAQAAKEQQAQQQTNAQQQVTQQQPAAGSVQRLEITLPNNKTASLSGTADDVNSLLEFLNQAGMRSLQ